MSVWVNPAGHSGDVRLTLHDGVVLAIQQQFAGLIAKSFSAKSRSSSDSVFAHPNVLVAHITPEGTQLRHVMVLGNRI